MIEKWVIFKRDYLEISFLRENCGYDGSDERRRHVWYLWWLMIIYAWLSTTQKQDGKILILPKNTNFLALCSVNRVNMHDIHGFCYGMSKETVAPISMMKIMHLQNREQITF